jgi:hypothetical protein
VLTWFGKRCSDSVDGPANDRIGKELIPTHEEAAEKRQHDARGGKEPTRNAIAAYLGHTVSYMPSLFNSSD